MQIYTLTQTHKHASITSLSFLQTGCPSCRPTNSIKALKAVMQNHWISSFPLHSPNAICICCHIFLITARCNTKGGEGRIIQVVGLRKHITESRCLILPNDCYIIYSVLGKLSKCLSCFCTVHSQLADAPTHHILCVKHKLLMYHSWKVVAGGHQQI